MPRKPRIEFPGAIYHVGTGGVLKRDIYLDAFDRQCFLEILGSALLRLDAAALAYCQMGNHYHVLLRTGHANLSAVMQRVNGQYARAFNLRHGRTGHLFESRYWMQLVRDDAYAFALCRYIEQNPVRAGFVENAARWRWSSCRAHLGQAPPPAWLDRAWVQGMMLGRDAIVDADRREAAERYAALVLVPPPALPHTHSPWTSTPSPPSSSPRPSSSSPAARAMRAGRRRRGGRCRRR